MRILHIVTLLSPDSAYGGPVRVALNQCASLNGRGHHTLVAAAAKGYADPPTSLQGVDVRGFPAQTIVPKIGFAGLRAVGMTRWLRQQVRDIDVAHVHLARDFVTLPAARVLAETGTPFVVQPHGMVDPSSRLLARPLDRVWTQPTLSTADAVFYLNPKEETDLRAVARGPLALTPLNNGVPQVITGRPSLRVQARPEVLFMARLHPRKRPGMFVRMAQRLLDDGLDVDFAVAGPDEGARHEIDTLLAARPDKRIRYEGAVNPDAVTARLSAATVYVLPSVDEPFPMSVLEAMSVGVPVVVTDSCGLAPLISDTGSGLVAGPDLDSLADAVRRLLTDSTMRRRMSANARRTAADQLGMAPVTDILEESYRRALGDARDRRRR